MRLARGRSGRALLAFSAGVLTASALPALPGALGFILLGLSTLGLAASRSLRPWAALPLGVLWFCGHATTELADAWPVARAGQTTTFEARVVGLPVQRDGRARVLFAPAVEARRDGVPARVLLGWYRPLEWFRPGETWRLTVRLEPPEGRVNPGLFDYRRYLLARGVGATGRIVAAERIDAGGWRGAFDRLRQRFADWLQAETADLDAAALKRALTVADRSAMSPVLDERLRRTGTAHLLSISGLHVGMVAGAAGLLAGLLVTPAWPWIRAVGRRRVMLCAGLAAAAGYAALAGFTLPTVRALIMLAAGFGALLWRLPIQPGRALLLALVAVLAWDPLSALSIGFWLSFGAVAVLIWAFSGRVRRDGPVRGLVRAQIAVGLGLLPLNLGIFGQWAPTALAANLVAIPLVAFWVLPALLLALVLFALQGPATWPILAAERGLAWFLELLDVLAGVDARFDALGLPAMPAPGWPELLLAAIGAVWLLAPRGWPFRLAGVPMLLPLLLPPAPGPGHGEFDVLVPDLGDGHAVAVLTERHTLLYGTGPGDGQARSLVPGTLAPLLRQHGRRAVDYIVVPFSHRDYTGGLAAARRAWPEAELVEPGADCVAGRHWALDGVTVRALHPSPGLPDLGGDSSCVLSVRGTDGAVLLTGGSGRIVQRRLARAEGTRTDVLVLPHRAASEAVEPGWLDVAAPRLAIATAGRERSDELAASSTGGMLAERSVPLLATGRCGALLLRFRVDRPLRPVAERLRQPRPWRRTVGCPLIDGP